MEKTYSATLARCAKCGHSFLDHCLEDDEGLYVNTARTWFNKTDICCSFKGCKCDDYVPNLAQLDKVEVVLD